MTNVVANFILKKMSKAFTPQEVIERQSAIVTDWMIDFINRRLLAEWNGTNAFVKREHVIECLKNKGYNPEAFEQNGGLKFENLFTAAGWRVESDRSGWLFTVVKGK